MARLIGTLLRGEEIATATWAFTIALGGQHFPFRPGQTVDLTYPDAPHRDAAGSRRTFSLAAAPGGDRLLVATRAGRSGLKRSLVEAPPGTPLEIEGPFGSFTLPRRPAAAVLLAGGIGVTPFRAMVEETVEQRLGHTLLLVHSNRTPGETPFLEDFGRWSGALAGFTYRPTMTGSVPRDAWTGERRRLGPELLAELLPADRNRPIYLVAGPERFVKGAVEALAALEVDEERIRTEEFPGYLPPAGAPAGKRHTVTLE